VECIVPEIKPAMLESLFGLIVHDLRNPAATMGANLSFVRDVADDPSVPPQEVADALSDAQQALTDLMRGLDQLAWIGRWCNGNVAAPTAVVDLRVALENAKKRVKYGSVEFVLPSEEMRVRGGEALERLIELLVANGHQHAPGKLVTVRAGRENNQVFVEVEDEGRPLAVEFHDSAFTLEGQIGLKGRADGRYSRVAGLFSAGVLALALESRIVPLEQRGKNVFRIPLKSI
jgi:signal transduction histidine kinase